MPRLHRRRLRLRFPLRDPDAQRRRLSPALVALLSQLIQLCLHLRRPRRRVRRHLLRLRHRAVRPGVTGGLHRRQRRRRRRRRPCTLVTFRLGRLRLLERLRLRLPRTRQLLLHALLVGGHPCPLLLPAALDVRELGLQPLGSCAARLLLGTAAAKLRLQGGAIGAMLRLGPFERRLVLRLEGFQLSPRAGEALGPLAHAHLAPPLQLATAGGQAAQHTLEGLEQLGQRGHSGGGVATLGGAATLASCRLRVRVCRRRRRRRRLLLLLLLLLQQHELLLVVLVLLVVGRNRSAGVGAQLDQRALELAQRCRHLPTERAGRARILGVPLRQLVHAAEERPRHAGERAMQPGEIPRIAEQARLLLGQLRTHHLGRLEAQSVRRLPAQRVGTHPHPHPHLPGGGAQPLPIGLPIGGPALAAGERERRTARSHQETPALVRRSAGLALLAGRLAGSLAGRLAGSLAGSRTRRRLLQLLLKRAQRLHALRGSRHHGLPRRRVRAPRRA